LDRIGLGADGKNAAPLMPCIAVSYNKP